MVNKIYSVFDKKSGLFSTLSLFVNHAAAMRSFQDAISTEGSVFCTHPEDFDLYCLGEFVEENGFIHAIDPREFVVSAKVICDIQRGERDAQS
ncbi:nonstructural protein [Blackfly microvirus SF02]|uniref:Nonstructural protein n=1 Tax=Blackfly microvirus SF02 TaxID=2576452 RepID=A0A4P8PPD1_9VIRU|nr:nonstructural protein [Blackfly microvirus SF02]